MQSLTNSRQFWVSRAAVFAAMTAILAQVGVSGANSNFATFLCTLVVVLVLDGLVWATGQSQPFASLSPRLILFVVLSGLATGASWLCCFRALQTGTASQVASVHKLSVVFVTVLAALFLGERLPPMAWGGVALIAAGAVMVAVAWGRPRRTATRPMCGQIVAGVHPRLRDPADLCAFDLPFGRILPITRR